MHTSVVKLRPETIVDLAKDVIRPAGWSCEWNIAALQKPVQCKIVLNSWNAYLQHLLRHCRQSKGPHGKDLACRLPRCNIPAGLTISSYPELARHVQTHLSRAQLMCPIKDCSSYGFTRPALLEDHFRETHADFINMEVPKSSPFLLPTWRPFLPDRSVKPPALPKTILPGTILIPPIRGTVRRATLESQESLDSIESFMGSQSLSPRKRPRKQLDMHEPEPEEEPEPNFFFDDLPEFDRKLEDIAVIRPIGPLLDVARPQDILDPKEFGNRPLKGTILYDNFVRIHGLEGDDESEEEEEGEG
ncbi:hypothetical protein BDN70DRAFT_880778 [Pholiota conissans]|uniref:C2H2-type domain-containing protein n=1 Tax=Pholiota conissans TaxID=109636 RepID=A0A9P5YZY0_9AGAR|nr:hypothetical protein BDN70DRAFT_880778 [Pholiota conissans]